MNLNNLSAKKICRLVSAGMVFSMLVITGIFGGIMQDIRIFIQLLEQVGNKNGEHEDEQALENGAIHQVHILVEEIFLCGDGLGHRVPASQN